MADLAHDLIAPIVVVSALDDREALEQAVLGGASAFLTKPVREDDLERALELAIARFGDMQELRDLRKEADERAQAQEAQLRELGELVRELRAARLHLSRATRRAAVTSLAQGLTHDINNALTPIVGNAQIIALLHGQDAETLERTRQIIEHARRIANWTASFREVTTEGKREPVYFSFNGLVRELVGLYGERFERLGIETVLDLDDSLRAVRGHSDQIQQALMLLLQNAIEAMPNGGKVVFRTRAPVGEALLATLSDSGGGIAAEDLPLVFDPGFTTKAGTLNAPAGWGLYTAREIMEAHGGALEVSSPAEGAAGGTTVRIRLPFAVEERA
jgi:signal transduction histidine kinase